MSRNLQRSYQHARSNDAAHAEISFEGNVTATVIAASSNNFSSAKQVTVSGTNGTSHEMTPDHTEDHLVVVRAGTYYVQATFNLTGTASDDISAAVFRNNKAEQVTPRSTKAIDSVDLDAVFTVSGLVECLVGDTLELWLQNETSTANVTVVDGVLLAYRIG